MFPSRRIITSGGDVFRDEYSVGFDGTDSRIIVGTDSSIDNIWAGGGTIAAWIKPTSDGENNYGRIVQKASGTSPTDGWYLVVSSESSGVTDFRFRQRWGSGVFYGFETTSREVTLDQWNHVAITFDQDSDSNNAIMYINGVHVAGERVDNPAGGTADDDSSRQLIIGNNGSFNRTFAGNMSELVLYNTILTASQIATIYNGREPYNHIEGVASGNVAAWWRFGDGVLDHRVANGIIADQTNATKGSNIVDGDFDTDTTGDWSTSDSTLSHASGAMRIVATSTSGNKGVYYNSLVTAGNTYHVKFRAKSDSSVAFTSVGNNNDISRAILNPTLTTSFQNYEFYTTTDAGAVFRLYVAARIVDDYLDIDDITIQKINGNLGRLTSMDDFEGDTP
jgi:hypothetical protein